MVKAFITGLRELGYEPGKNIVLEFRHAEGRTDRLSALVTELMAQNAEIIVVESSAAAIVAKKASQTVPIVVAIALDRKREARLARSRRYKRNRRPGIRAGTVRITDGELDRLVELGYLGARGDKKAGAETLTAALTEFLA